MHRAESAHPEVVGAAEVDPVETVGSRLHLCQICTAYFKTWEDFAYASVVVPAGTLGVTWSE